MSMVPYEPGSHRSVLPMTGRDPPVTLVLDGGVPYPPSFPTGSRAGARAPSPSVRHKRKDNKGLAPLLFGLRPGRDEVCGGVARGSILGSSSFTK